MKKIQQLAEQYWSKQPYNEDAYVEGYKQCQKDMSTLETQYKNWMLKNPNNKITYVEWLESFNEIHNLPSDMSDWDVTLNDGLEDEPYISDDFQIGPDDAYEHNDNMTPKEKAAELVDKFSNECLLTTDGGKVAALIAVNEILKDREEIDGMRIINDPYWMEVKQELKKL